MISIRDLHEGSRRQTVRAIRPERKLSLYPPSRSAATSSEQPPPPCLHLFPCCLCALSRAQRNIRRAAHLSSSLNCYSEFFFFFFFNELLSVGSAISRHLKVKTHIPTSENSFPHLRTHTHTLRLTAERAVLILTVHRDVTGMVTNSHQRLSALIQDQRVDVIQRGRVDEVTGSKVSACRHPPPPASWFLNRLPAWTGSSLLTDSRATLYCHPPG